MAWSVLTHRHLFMRTGFELHCAATEQLVFFFGFSNIDLLPCRGTPMFNGIQLKYTGWTLLLTLICAPMHKILIQGLFVCIDLNNVWNASPPLTLPRAIYSLSGLYHFQLTSDPIDCETVFFLSFSSPFTCRRLEVYHRIKWCGNVLTRLSLSNTLFWVKTIQAENDSIFYVLIWCYNLR